MVAGNTNLTNISDNREFGFAEYLQCSCPHLCVVLTPFGPHSLYPSNIYLALALAVPIVLRRRVSLLPMLKMSNSFIGILFRLITIFLTTSAWAQTPPGFSPKTADHLDVFFSDYGSLRCPGCPLLPQCDCPSKILVLFKNID